MQNRIRNIIIGAFGLALSGTAALADVQIQSITGANWQIDAQNEPLTGVLKAIANKVGIKVSGTTKLRDDPMITGKFEGSLEDILPRLMRSADYAFETRKDAQGNARITRLIVLSGIKGRAPTARAVNTARKLPPARTSSASLSADEKAQGARVTSLLTKRAQLNAGIQAEAAPDQNADTKDDPKRTSGSGITRNADGGFDISPEAQARMAEATRRAQQDLQALVAAIRRNENNTNGDN